jgi:hypothetical protein
MAISVSPYRASSVTNAFNYDGPKLKALYSVFNFTCEQVRTHRLRLRLGVLAQLCLRILDYLSLCAYMCTAYICIMHKLLAMNDMTDAMHIRLHINT